MSRIIFLVVVLAAAAVQSRLPTCWWLGGLRLELLPALVACAALTWPRTGALGLALLAGLAQDALSGAPFGLTALAYGVAAGVLSALRATLDRDLPWVQMGAGALTALAAAVAGGVAHGHFLGSVPRALALAAVAAVLTPLLMEALDALRQWAGANDH